MKKISNKELDIKFQIKAIELLNSSIKVPTIPNKSTTNFKFNIGIENRIDIKNELIFIIVHTEIKDENQSDILGNLSVSCIFELTNFSDVVTVDHNDKANIPQNLIETLNSISISTARGVMFSTFKGTFLHNAILPVIIGV